MRRLVMLAALVSTQIPVWNVTAQIPEIEREALIALYDATNGAGWTNNSGWATATMDTECTWHGVSCNAGHVTEVILYSNQLSGVIPSELGDLSSLEALGLSSNQLTGSIPPELGKLSSLDRAWLDGNQLTGNIPPELGNLSNLEALYFDGNQLTGSIPPELGKLINLEALSFHDNQLNGSIPPEMGNLGSLTWLYLSSNQLNGSIPPELGNLSNLESLYLQGNQLNDSIPPELGDLSSLTRLGLSSNQLTGSIPPELGSLSSLIDIILRDNQLSGKIPAELGNLASLRCFYLDSNQLVGPIPPELGNLSDLVGCARIGYNALWTGDPILQAFLYTADPYWDQTQTIAPADVAVGSETSSSFVVSWTPILYTADSGWYLISAPVIEIFSDGFEGGDTSMWGAGSPTAIPVAFTTVDKTDNSILIDGLEPDTLYKFVVRAVTEPHWANQNQVISEESEVVFATTTP